jgi:hypothetical protein
MQVQGADMGLAHNLGGPGAVSAVAVLSQPDGCRRHRSPFRAGLVEPGLFSRRTLEAIWLS